MVEGKPMLPPKAPSMLLHHDQILFILCVSLNTWNDEEEKKMCEALEKMSEAEAATGSASGGKDYFCPWRTPLC